MALAERPPPPPPKLFSSFFINDTITLKIYIRPISPSQITTELFQSRGEKLCKFISTKVNINPRKAVITRGTD